MNTQAWRKEQKEIRQTISQHELAKDLPAKYVMAEPEEKREILAFVASNYTLTDTTLMPAHNKPFCWLAEFVKTKSGGP